MSEAKAIEPTLYVDVSSMDLLFKDCACGELHIFGFYHQITPEQKVVDREAMTVTLTQDCRKCGKPVQIIRALSKDKKKRTPHEQQQRINELEQRLARIAEIFDKAEVVAEIPTGGNAGASRVAFKLPEAEASKLAALLAPAPAPPGEP